jgi:hypothetical protein
MIIQTIVQGDEPTESGRTLSTEELTKALEVYNQKDVRLGEVMDENFTVNSSIDLANTAFIIEDAFLDEDNILCAQIKPLDTPMGKIIFHEGLLPNIKFTPRYSGVVNEDGTVTDIEMISIDAYNGV